MKLRKSILALLLALASANGVVAQGSACGLNAGFTVTTNPNSAHVFTSTSSAAPGWQITGYQWNFGTGATSTQQNPTYFFSNPGVYTVCLIITGGSTTSPAITCKDTFCSTVSKCNGIVQTGFTFSSNNGSNPFVFVGNASSNYPPISYSWNFQGGSPAASTTQTTTVQFPNAGAYNVCLTATDSIGCNATNCQSVQVGSSSPCVGTNAQFTANVSGNSVTLQASQNNPTGTNYQWWLDGQAGSVSNTLQSFSYQNLTPGTHNICLYVYAPTNSQTYCDSSCKTITIGGGTTCNVTANFTQSYGSTGGVNFTGAQNNVTVQHYWSFGDGNTSTLPNPTHFYGAGGLYTVCHYVNVPGTTCRDTVCKQVQATTGQPCLNFAVAVNVSTSPTSGAATINAVVTGAPAGSGLIYSWNTGSTAQSFTTTSQGYYCVTVTTSQFNCSATACDSFQIGNPCNVQVSITSQQQGGVYSLTAAATGGAAPYQFVWSNNASNTALLTVTAPGTYCVSAFDANQCVGSACFTVQGSAPKDTICGYVFFDSNGNGVLDPGENPIPGAQVNAGNFNAVSDSSGFYAISVPLGGTYTIWYCAPSGNSYTIPISPNSAGTLNNCATYVINTSLNTTAACGYNFGIQNNSVSICGKVFFDANNNGQQDQNTESGINGVHVYVTSTAGNVYHAWTNQNGNYCVLVPAGSYTITIASGAYASCAISPSSITVANATGGQSLSNKNFAIYCQPGVCDVKIDIVPGTTVTPGFPAWYHINVYNMGYNVANGTVNMYYDPALVFNMANPTQASHNASTQTLSFNLINLLPGANKSFFVKFNAPQNLPLGQFVFNLANVSLSAGCNDVNLTNNVDTTHQNVTGSWDPNNKLAVETNVDNPSFQMVSSVNAYQKIEYVINFQNTGTAPAVNVVIEDFLTGDLDAGSFEFTGSSHPCLVTADGNHLNFKFSDIMLPDSVSDEPNSHGYVTFTINAINNLAAGHVISDDAAIYFDFNEPVITNDAVVTMIEPSAIEDLVNTTITVAPNPVSSFAAFRLNGSNENFRLVIMDMTGRVVADRMSTGNTLTWEREGIAAGVYAYQVIQHNLPVAKGKLVLQ